MDHKMQQIHSGMQEIRQLEQRVNQLRDEKVGIGANSAINKIHIGGVCLM